MFFVGCAPSRLFVVPVVVVVVVVFWLCFVFVDAGGGRGAGAGLEVRLAVHPAAAGEAEVGALGAAGKCHTAVA